MTKKILAFGIAAVLILGTAAVAIAAVPGIFPSSGSNFGLQSKLNLTDEQYSKLRDIQAEFFQKMTEFRSDMAKISLELQDLYLSKNPDQKAIDEKLKELNDLRNKMFDLKWEYYEKIKGLLTEEQLSQLGGLWGLGFGMGPGFCHGFGNGMMGRVLGPGI